MGGSSFSTSSNHVYVHVDKPFYFPGEPVCGVVLMNCVTPFQATSLVLKVQGEEEASFEERIEHQETVDGETRTRTETNLHSRDRNLFKVKVPLMTFPQQVAPGQYQFPFSIMLPLAIPGTFELRESSHMMRFYNIRASVEYKIQAEVEVPGIISSNLKYKQALLVHQRPSKPASEVVVGDTQTVKTCCCCSQGNATMTARVQKDCYYPGETAQLVLEVDNTSTVAFKKLTASLVRVVRLKGGAGMEMQDTLCTANFPGLQPGEKQQGAAARVMALPLPGMLLPSTQGEVVSCTYHVELRLKAPACTSDLLVALPITLYTAVPPHVPLTSAPPGWQPGVVQAPVQVALPSAPPFPPDIQVMGYPAVPPAGAAAPDGYVPPAPVLDGPVKPSV